MCTRLEAFKRLEDIEQKKSVTQIRSVFVLQTAVVNRVEARRYHSALSNVKS